MAKLKPAPVPKTHEDESPINLERFRQRLPQWLQRFLPSGGGQHDDLHGKSMFGLTIFLLSESTIFVSFFVTYIVLRSFTIDWIPPGVTAPHLSAAIVIQTIVLLASSFVIYFAEQALDKGKIARFRLLWLLTSAMGSFFLLGTLKEWADNDFGLTTGLMGSTYYILTGFHGLHVTAGILLQVLIFTRSFKFKKDRPGHFGVSAVSLFWHFVDVIWIIVFSLLYLWRT
jgi:cytochrome c oxidase subunit III